MRARRGAPLGDVFSFVSGLYFRGKLAYARQFASPARPCAIRCRRAASSSSRRTPAFARRRRRSRSPRSRRSRSASIDLTNDAYRVPIERAATALRDAVGDDCQVVLLGSIASGKYVEVLQPIFGDNLVFPPAFVGRGDMSRGGLMLRCVADGTELDYVPVSGAVRHGKRPPKLAPLANAVGCHLTMTA